MSETSGTNVRMRAEQQDMQRGEDKITYRIGVGACRTAFIVAVIVDLSEEYRWQVTTL